MHPLQIKSTTPHPYTHQNDDPVLGVLVNIRSSISKLGGRLQVRTDRFPQNQTPELFTATSAAHAAAAALSPAVSVLLHRCQAKQKSLQVH